MIRKLVFASFLGVFGFLLYGQNTAVSGDGRTTKDSQNAGAPAAGTVLPRTRSPNAQVTVSPGPQGLPIVNSSASAWPLGPVLGEGGLEFWLNGAPQTNGVQVNSPNPPPNPPARSSNGKPVFEPPPMGGLPSFAAPRTTGRPAAAADPDIASPDPDARRNPPGSGADAGLPQGQDNPSESSPGQGNRADGVQGVSQTPPQNGPLLAQETAPQSRGGQVSPPARNGAAAAGRASQAPQPAVQGPQQTPAKKVVVIPSAVHYDRAGRRVIDPSWQETMYRIIQAEREAQEAAKERSGAGSEPPPPEEKAAAADQEKVRETIILVPGPVMRRIRGSLTVAKGMLALEDAEGVLWYLPGLDRYIGYIEGLDAGEEAAVEGYAPPRGSSQERYFQPVKLFIDEMEYDLAVPPEGVYLGGGQTTVIREIERRNGGDSAVERFPSGDRKGGVRPLGRDSREDGWYGDEEEDSAVQDRRRPGKRSAPPPAQPVWEHPHRSPWSPPASVLDFKVDSDSFWQDDPVKREQRERDSREIWY